MEEEVSNEELVEQKTEDEDQPLNIDVTSDTNAELTDDEPAAALIVQGYKRFYHMRGREGRGAPAENTDLSTEDPPSPPDNTVKPALQIIFTTYTVKSGENLIVEIPLTGQPAPNIEWKINDNPVKETSRLELSTTASQTVLHIRHATRAHSGKYSIIASNTAGTFTGEVSVIVLEKPDPPKGPVRIKEVSSDYISIAWDPPEYTGGCELDNYIVEKHDVTNAGWQTVSATIVRTTIKITRLKTGVDYQFRVFAENRYGKSTPITSPLVTAQYPFSVPDPPGPPYVSTVTKCNMLVEWQPPSIDGGSPLLGYHLERKEKNTILWTKLNKLIILDHRFKAGALQEGMEYQFRAFAENIAGLSSASKTSESYVARDPCDAPGKPESVVVTREHVTLQWEKPKFDGGSTITSYIVDKKDLPDGKWMRANFTNIIENMFTVTGLTEGQRYEFRVTAKNAAGVWSAPSEAVTIIATDVVEAPTAFLDAKFKNTVVFQAGETFVIKADYYGKPLPAIVWLKDKKEIDKSTPKMDVKTSITQTALTVRDCTRMEGGQFVLRLVNSSGTLSLPINVTVLDRPGPPDGTLKVKSVSADRCNLHWNTSLNDGGDPVTHYIIEKRETCRVTWTEVDNHVNAVNYKVTKLVPGKEYVFRIAAVNSHGVGEFLESDAFVAQYPFTTPSAPSTPTVTAVTGESVALTWERPETDGGAEIEGYILEKLDKDGFRWTKCNKRRLNDLRFRCVGLIEEHYYQFRVMAENAAGVGAPSEPTDYIKVCEATYPPGPPTNPKVVDYSSNTVSLTWSRPIYDGGETITGFVVEMKETEEEEWFTCTPSNGVEETKYTVRKLKENAEYNFRIRAKNASGIGEAVDLPEPVTATERMEAPEIEQDSTLRKIVDIRACSTLRLCVAIKGRPEPEIKWSKEDGSPCSRAQIEITNSHTVLMIENVNRDDTGKYVLTAENCKGTKSAFINVRVLDSPSAPTDLQVKDVRKDSVTISWEEPDVDGGSKITHYIVEKREEARMAFASVCNNCVRNSYKINNLQEGSLYYFRVLAVNEYGSGIPIETTEAVKASEAPLPPGKITISDVMSNNVTLSWEKPDDDGGSKITYYIVEMQEEGDDSWTICSETKAPEVTINDLTLGKEYAFRVSAVNEKGKSEPKSLFAPVIIKDTTAEPVINLLTNSFGVKAGNDLKIDVPFKGVPAPTVVWKKDGILLKETNRVNVHTSDTSSQMIIKDAVKLDVGVYEVAVSNSVGSTSAEIMVNVFERPGPPSNLSADEVSADFVSLSWQPPNYTGGCELTNYIVKRRETTNAEWTIVSATVARTSIKISRLIQGNEYQFCVAAENRHGKSSFTECEPIMAQYSFSPPAPPTNVHVELASKSLMVIAWNDPESDGGSPIMGYHIEFKNQSSVLWTKLNRSLVFEKHFKVTTVEEGLMYEFRVYAENMAGIGECSKTTDPVPARDQCEPPRNVTVANITDSTVSLSWDKPEYDGGAKITAYIVERKELPDTCWLKCNFNNLLETSLDVTGLTEGEQYDFRVIAKNSAELFSAPSESTGPVTVKYDMISPKVMLDDRFSELVIVNAGECIKIDAEISGRPNPTVTWLKNGRNIGSKGRVEMTATKLQTSLIIRDCVRKDSGQYTLTLENCSGTTSQVVTFKVLDRPGPPAGPLEVIGLSAEKCTLSWGPPPENGGAEIMHYIVEKCETSRVAWTLVSDDMEETTCSIAKLVKGNEYLFRVRAVNKFGVGEILESEPIKAVDPFTVPSAPMDIDVTNPSSENMTICWKRPDSDGGSPITGYIVEKREKQGVHWVRVNKKPLYDLRLKAYGLHEGCEYEFRVLAENSAGIGEPSLPSPLILAENPKFLPTAPTKPTIVDSTRSSITLSWSKPLFDGGAKITGYKVDFRESINEDWSVGVDSTDKTEFTVTGLTSGIEYVFVVRSINKIGLSEPSPETDPEAAVEREEKPAFEISSDMRKTILVRDGCSFTLSARYTGKPTPIVSWHKANADLRVRGLINTTSCITSVTVEGATRDDSGKYIVKLENTAGSASLTLNVNVLDSPGPPRNLLVKDVTNTSATVTWDIPENEGGSSVNNYLVDIRYITRPGWTRLTDKCLRLSYTASDLEERGIYFFRVAAQNDYGIGVPAQTKEGTQLTEPTD